MKHARGFTLIELMIVVAIIGIIAAIALPQYQAYTAKSQASEGYQLAARLKLDVAEVGIQDGTFDNADSGASNIPPANSVSGRYVASGSVTNGVITITFRPAGQNGTSTLIAGTSIMFTPRLTAGAVQWQCGGSLAAAYRPKDC